MEIKVYEIKGYEGTEDYFHVLSIKLEGYYFIDIFAISGVLDYCWNLNSAVDDFKIVNEYYINIPDSLYENLIKNISVPSQAEDALKEIKNKIKKLLPHYFI